MFKSAVPENFRAKLAVRFVLALAVTLILCRCSEGLSATNAKDQLRTITTVNGAHSLPSKVAALAYPVHLRAVVTNYFAHPKYISVWVHDSTGEIYVSATSVIGSPVAGSLVDVVGVTDPGFYAPVVEKARISVVGFSGLPIHARRVSLPFLLTGAADAGWVEVEGVIHSVEEQDGMIELQLAMTDGTIGAETQKEAGVDYQRLIDAKVLLRANASPLFNKTHQVIGARLAFPGLSTLHVVEAGPSDPFSLPVVNVDQLSGYDRIASLSRRVHVRGRVTLQWEGTSLCIADATHGICAETEQQTRLAIGDVADVVGFVATGSSGPVLTDAIFQQSEKQGGSLLPVAANRLTAGEALDTEHDANLIQIEGKLIGRDLAAADTTLILASGSFIFSAVLPARLRGPEADGWQNGSTLQLTGICSVLVDARSSARDGGSAVPKSFRILLRSPQDVVVLQRPSWWTPVHAVAVLSVLLFFTLAVLIWVIALRRRVQEQTAVIRESEERFRHLAQHDALTGLATRLLLYDRLNLSLLRAKRNGSYLALLMLDLDKFKPINDTLGHDAGDHTLCVTADRLRQVVRATDTVARLGGDEFVVLLSDLDDPRYAEQTAAKIVEALSLPIVIGDRSVPISVSVGVCTALGGEQDAPSLLKSADTALYRAKGRGRACFEVFCVETSSSGPISDLSVEAAPAVTVSRG